MGERIHIPLRTAQRILWEVHRRGLGARGEKRDVYSWRIPWPYDRPTLYSLRAFRAALEEGLPRILERLPRGKPITFVGTGESSRRAFYILEATMKNLPELFNGVKMARIAHLSLPFSPHHMGRDWRELQSGGSIYSKSDYLPRYLPEITAELLGRKEHVVARDSRGREYHVVGENLRNDPKRLKEIVPNIREVIVRRNPYYALYRDVIRGVAEGKTALFHLDTLFWTRPDVTGGTAWYVEETLRRLARMHGMELPEIQRAAFVEMYPGTRLRDAIDRADRGVYRPTEREDLVFSSVIHGPLDSRLAGDLIPTHVRRVENTEAMAVVHPSGVIYLTHLKPVKR